MKTPFVLLALVSISLATAAAAQEPAAPTPARRGDQQRGTVPAPDGAEFYLRQLRQADDAAFSIRRKAEFRAQQRLRRMAAMQWFGLSNSRPTASATPWSSRYSPGWVSNTRRPFAWSGTGPTMVVTRVESPPRH